MSLHRTTGGNLPALLDRLAAATRDRNQFEGQYRAATVLGRYSAGFILFMVGVILVILFFFHRDFAMRFFEVSPWYTVTDSSLASLRDQAVPEATLANLNILNGKVFQTREQLADEVKAKLTGEEFERFRDPVLNSAVVSYDYLGVILFAAAIGLEIVGGVLLYLLLKYEY